MKGCLNAVGGGIAKLLRWALLTEVLAPVFVAGEAKLDGDGESAATDGVASGRGELSPSTEVLVLAPRS